MTQAAKESAGSGERPKAGIEPHVIAVPEALSREIDGLVETLSRRLGPDPAIRTLVEVAVLKRGIESLKAEEGKR
jgi:hypothetical protein